MSIIADRTDACTTTPWWRDYGAARLLHRAAADGATITNAVDYYGGEYADVVGEFYGSEEELEWFLNVDYGSKARAVVRYTPDTGFWRLSVNSESLCGGVDDQMAAAYAVAQAAKLCRDLNALSVRRMSREQSALTDEILALTGDRGMIPPDLAAILGVTYGVAMTKISGAVQWSAVDLFKIAAAMGDDADDIVVRLLEAVTA